VRNGALAKPLDSRPARCIRGLGGDVALGVEAERPVVQIRRADAQYRVIIDRDLGVDDNPRALARLRGEGEESIVSVSLFQSKQDLGTSSIHGDPVEPARTGSG
jgi:hypothetical protein